MRVRARKNFTSARAGNRSQGEVFDLDEISAQKLMAVGAVEPFGAIEGYQTKVIVETPTVDPPAETPAEEVPATLPLESGADATVSSPPAARASRRKTRKRSQAGGTDTPSEGES